MGNLPKGTIGIFQRIDKDGDAFVKFDGERVLCVPKRQLHKLQKREFVAGSTVSVSLDGLITRLAGIPIPKGTMGKIIQFDGSGDAQIEFEGHYRPLWILKSELYKLSEQAQEKRVA